MYINKACKIIHDNGGQVYLDGDLAPFLLMTKFD